MKARMRWSNSLFSLILLLLAACAPVGAAQPAPEQTATPPNTAVPETELPPVAVLAAQTWLAGQLGIPTEDVALEAYERMEWSDSCLGLGGPAESCLQAITPGWMVTLSASGQTYLIRTDETGASVRPETPFETGGLSGTSWVLVSFGPQGAETPVLVPGALTLKFQPDGLAVGSGGCNSFSGPYQAQGSGLTFGPLSSTKRACSEGGLMQQEQQYFAALQNASAYALNGDALTITSAEGVLTFALPTADEAAWTRQQFGEAWDVAFPSAWAVNAAGEAEGAIQFEGPWEAHTYRVDLSFPIGLSAETLEAWVEAELAALTPEERAQVAIINTVVAGIPAKLVLNLPAAGEPAPRHHAYIWRTEAHNPRLVAISQVDGQAFDAAAMAGFLERFLAEIHIAPGANPEARLPGILDFHADGMQGVITAPDTAAAGEAVEVTILTFGSGCERAGETDVILTPEGAAILVYDFTVATEPGIACPAILQRLEHTATLRFDAPGEYKVQIWGRRVGPETTGLGQPILLEHTITVS